LFQKREIKWLKDEKRKRKKLRKEEKEEDKYF